MPGTNFYTPISATCWVAFTTETQNSSFEQLAMMAKCTGTPPTTANVFEHGCIMTQTDTSSGSPSLYENTGTSALPVWNLIGAVSPGEITLAEGQVLVGNSSSVAAASSAGAITVKSLAAGATGVVFTMYHDSASPAASDVVASLVAQGEDSAGNAQGYSKIDTVIRDATSTTEDGDMLFSVTRAGTSTQQLALDSDVNGVLVGDGAGSARVTSNGAFDLVLDTNSGTSSSNVTITDAANGNVTMNLNGTAITEAINSDAGALGAVMKLTHASASPAVSDVVGRLLVTGRDDAAAAEDYGRIDVVLLDATAANPDSNMQFLVDAAGTLTEKLKLDTDVTVTPAATGNVIVAGGRGVVSNVATVIGTMKAVADQETAAPAAALSLAAFSSLLNSTAGATTQTLAAGNVIGLHKRIQMIVDGGDDVVTITSLSGGTIITFADVGDVAELMWNGTNWIAIALYNCADGATAPVLS